MAYTKQTWECGDLITADKMNHIEDGIEEASSGGGTEPLVVGVNVTTEGTTTTYTLDKTWQQIHDAYPNVYIGTANESLAVLGVSIISGIYGLVAYAVPQSQDDASFQGFRTDTANGYPFRRVSQPIG